MNTLVVDPGLVEWAYAVLNKDGVLLSRTVQFKDKKASQAKRLYQSYEYLVDAILTHKVTKVIVEAQFSQLMGLTTSPAHIAAGSVDIPLVKLQPTRWRLLMAGHGRASEDQVLEAVQAAGYDTKGLSEHEIDCRAMYLASVKLEEGGGIVKPKRKTNASGRNNAVRDSDDAVRRGRVSKPAKTVRKRGKNTA